MGGLTEHEGWGHCALLRKQHEAELPVFMPMCKLIHVSAAVKENIVNTFVYIIWKVAGSRRCRGAARFVGAVCRPQIDQKPGDSTNILLCDLPSDGLIRKLKVLQQCRQRGRVSTEFGRPDWQ